MNRDHASQIADLLNSHNELVVRYDADRVLKSADDYLFEQSGIGVAIACLELKRVQWYQFEINHLTVAPEFRGKCLAKKLLRQAEDMATNDGGCLLQCAILEDNKPSQGLFKKIGFSEVVRFHYPKSGNNVGVWQKVISPAI